MVTRNSQVRPIPLEIKAGVHPDTDSTPLATDHYVMSQGIRMFNGVPRKIGGWISRSFYNGNTIQGYTRSLYSTIFDSGNPILLIGSNVHLYALSGNILTNITPFQEDDIVIGNILTNYGSLAANPVTTVDGSNIVNVLDADAPRYEVGDVVYYTGASSVNGISAALLNAPHVLRSVGSTYYTFQVNDPATSSGTGGGTITRSSGLLTITDTAHEMPEGNRVKIEGASATGGITAPQINQEFVIRNVTANTFDVMTSGNATSSVSADSGSYYPEILAGPSTEFTQQGYGAGLYGEGPYGAPGVSTTNRVTPRIWYFDKFGESVLTGYGDKIYQWTGTAQVAPTILPNAPDGVKYFFVSDNILVTLGSGGLGNHIFASDQGDATQWTASSLNQVFEDYIEGADDLISHAPVTGQNLLFSAVQTYSFRYVGKDAGVWQIKKLDGNVGIIAPQARVSINGVAYWMGNDNFYMYRGGTVEIIPANTQKFTTLLNYVFQNINRDQTSKCFAEFNQKYNEVWFHYPTADSEEPNAIARLSLTDYSWVPDRMDRTAAENNGFYFQIPHMANTVNGNSILYQHETGLNADGSPLPWMIKTNLRSGGKDSTSVVNLVPDSIQTGKIGIKVENYTWPNSPIPAFNTDYTFQDNDTNVPLQLNGHFWQYTVSGDVLNQQWIMGQWYEYVQMSSPQ